MIKPLPGEWSSARPTHRNIAERIVITGTLWLDTPAHFGNGDRDALTDMPLLEDELDGSPLLLGTSIAGALRNYLREYAIGYGQPPPQLPNNLKDERAKTAYEAMLRRERDLLATMLFGGHRGDDEGAQSPLVVHDAPGHATGFELRDGVKIDPETRTAAEDKKFDIRLLAAGTCFDLRFELLVGHQDDQDYHAYKENLLKAAAIALDGLASGEISLGMRRRRGFGRCRVDEWTVYQYDLATRKGLLAWLAEGRGNLDAPWVPPIEATCHSSIAEALGVSLESISDNRKAFELTATFAVDGSLMIRSGFGESDHGPDMVHLHSLRRGSPGQLARTPVAPGTSWAGILRNRAIQIANTLAGDPKRASRIIEDMFGPENIDSKTKAAWASRLEVEDSIVENARMLEQSRVKIDRFTGGVSESALFNEQPLFGGEATRLRLFLRLRSRDAEADSSNRQNAEVGLILLLLKDLWTGDLPLGGETSVGRGRLRGLHASFSWEGGKWSIRESETGGLEIQGDKQALNSFVADFRRGLSNDRPKSADADH
jgi:CRISPR/Cas system CSM-associated protein Csm3 (group 7 of RAMP superfamily)